MIMEAYHENRFVIILQVFKHIVAFFGLYNIIRITHWVIVYPAGLQQTGQHMLMPWAPFNDIDKLMVAIFKSPRPLKTSASSSF